MTERPILFSGPMVRAILDGRKTVTRRVAKPVKHPDLGNIYAPGALVLEKEPQHVIERACPYGQPGDRLWVRETFAVYGDKKMHVIHYRADRPHHVGQKGMGYKPSIHMPRWASRILLEITAVRVERLQEISEEQAKAEGIFFKDYGRHCFHGGGPTDVGNCPGAENTHPQRPGWSWRDTDSHEQCNDTARWAFANLWGSVGGDWNANPWVWVVEFKRVTP